MNTHRFFSLETSFHKLASIVGCAVILAFMITGDRSESHQAAYAASLAVSNTYTVNSTADLPDPNPFSPICAAPIGQCTLRAAIMDANFAGGVHTVVLPVGVYTLTRPGYDDNALLGDLDIAHDLTIQGAGSGATIIDGNGSVTKDRVFQILSSASQITMTGLTIRNGQSLSSTVGIIGGGGLYMEGSGHLLLRNVVIQSNIGQNGGGLYTNFSTVGGSIEMDNVIVRANTATAGGVGAGGGVFAYLPSSLSVAAIQDGQIYSNTADGTGGGFFVEGNTTAHWSIQRSEMYSNTAASGGAIGNFVPLVLSDSRLHNNRVTFDGGAIEAFAPLAISRTTLDSNLASRFGGAIFDLQTGGASDFAHIEQSTLSNNAAQYGGGVYHDGFIEPSSLLSLINSTLSGNSAFRPISGSGSSDGGGVYVYGGWMQLINATIASNIVNPGFGLHTHIARGGGLFITATASITVQDTLIGNNLSSNGINVATEDDCFSFGTVGTLAFDLIQNTTNCYVTGPQGGDIVGQDAHLGPLQNNGGSTPTRALLPGSPAIDNGAFTGCTDESGNPLTIDQRGWRRPIGSRCDIGAFEYSPFAIDLPLIQR